MLKKQRKIKVSVSRKHPALKDVKYSYYKAPPIPSSSTRIKSLGRRGYVNGYLTRIYSLPDLYRLWDNVSYPVVKSWYKRDCLPPPFITVKDEDPRYKNGAEKPIWIEAQVRAIHRVLNEHWRRGNGNLNHKHVITLTTMYYESENARTKVIEDMQNKRRSLYRLGVEWIDHPLTPRWLMKRKKDQRVVKWDRTVHFSIED